MNKNSVEFFNGYWGKTETYPVISNENTIIENSIFEGKDSIGFSSDIIRAQPLFYGLINNEWFITDNLSAYQKKNESFDIDQTNLEQYIASGFVYGNGTIYKDVYALQAGEVITIKGNEIHSQRYFEFKPKETLAIFSDINFFTKALDQVFLSVFKRMLEQTPEVNRWIIPLSGGHDSRIIVNYLHRLDVKNVVCFSYGTPGNEQSEISKKVAETLGYEWHFVEYTEQKWQALHENGKIDAYIEYAFNGVSTPHLQDFLAVYELKEKGLLQEGDVFVPGHTLDFVSGGHLNDLDLSCKTKKDAVKRVFLRHSRIRDFSPAPVRTIEGIFENARIKPNQFQEYFNWQERQAKFIVNSIRAYEFFGYEACPSGTGSWLISGLQYPPKCEKAARLFLKQKKTGF
ncbi:hypothetical protein AT05_02365 [Schleiferia thermophila str. Yellowstone]|jgi:asparagine synthase (glutamine-hydrolysing)|uniref:asparagine synthase-related protein n=1 Tax=Schleiferia thermophila TaxID=884107 RepID=UPI0004E681F8|nr:asparagine synthetase B family protein [Schleiferia thermophila]KFD40375.1 hypothetical protein AT05_02365 [Schleiferia thermophila str. Yellowstone]